MSSARAVQAETSPEGVSCSTHRRSRSRMRASTRAWSIGIMDGKDLVRMAFRQPPPAFVGGLDRGEDTEADRRIGVQDPLDRWRPTPDVSGTGGDRGIGTAEGCAPPDGDGVVVTSVTTTPCRNGRITPATAASRPQAGSRPRPRAPREGMLVGVNGELRNLGLLDGDDLAVLAGRQLRHDEVV